MSLDTEKIKGFETDMAADDQKAGEEMAFLKNAVLKGNVKQEDLKIFILDEVYEHIKRYAQTDLKNELGGVLLGRLVHKDAYDILIVNGVLDAKHTVRVEETLEFTEKTWDSIHREKEAYFTDSEVIGWFHTCPGYGVFLSTEDAFVQNNFSDFLWQLACVADPVSNNMGFFHTQNGRIKPCSGFYIYSKTRSLTEEMFDEIPKVARKRPSTSGQEQRREEKKHMPSRIRVKENSYIVKYGMTIALMILVLILAVSHFQLNQKYKKLEEAVGGENIQKDVSAQGNKINALEERLAALEGQPGEQPEQPDNENQAPEDNPRIVPQEPVNSGQDNVDGQEYVVGRGETLWQISQKFYGSGKHYKAIMEANGIDEESKVKAGQKIVLPVIEE